MKLGPAVTRSLRYLSDYKLRSTLTTLGLVIGVATIVVFVVMSAGVQASVLQTVGGDDANVVYVSTKLEDRGGPPIIAQGGTPIFTEHDVTQIRQLPEVTAVVPLGTESMAVTHQGETEDRLQTRVTSASYFTAVRDEPFVAGGPFRDGEPEIVVNRQAAEQFDDPLTVGDEVVVNGHGVPVNATVVGIVESAPSISDQLTGDPPRPRIYGPADPFNQRTVVRPGTDETQDAFRWVFAVAADSDDALAVRGAITLYLSEESDARQLLAEGEAFSVTTSEQWADHVAELTATFVSFAAAVSVISLFVGATGIVNIMIVSVTGRVREIGVIRAIGAQRRDVLQLFLTESALLGVLGSVLGVALGLVIAHVATGMLDLPLIVDVEWLVVALIVGIAVSVLAGAYPAWQASLLDPIEALRRE